MSVIERLRQRDGKPEDSLDYTAKTGTQNVPTLDLTESKQVRAAAVFDWPLSFAL